MKVQHEWYAALFAPDFHLQTALQGKVQTGCYAVCETKGRKPLVMQCNASAQHHKVEIGMTQVQALARCPELQFLESSPEQQNAAQQMLLDIAEQISPFIESTAPGVVILALPFERKWTEAELNIKLARPFQSRGWQVKVGVAQNPETAFLAAQFADPIRYIKTLEEFLTPLSVEALQPSEDCLSVLNSWGIRTIGQMTALPHAEVCKRLGPEAVELWERATGEHRRALHWIKPQERYVERADLEQPVEMLEPLLFLLRRFLEQLTARLAQAYKVVGQLHLTLFFSQGEPYERLFNIPEPNGNVAMLFRTLQTHLDGFTSDWPITGLELMAEPACSSSQQRDLFAQGLRDPQRFAETLSRLQALLGLERVGQAQLAPSYDPEAFHLSPYQMTEISNEQNSHLEDNLEKVEEGAIWFRFRPSIAAELLFENHQPIFLTSTHYRGKIVESRGPWYQEGNWWQSHAWSREEWDVALTDGGLYRLVRLESGWYLEGQYV